MRTLCQEHSGALSMILPGASDRHGMLPDVIYLSFILTSYEHTSGLSLLHTINADCVSAGMLLSISSSIPKMLRNGSRISRMLEVYFWAPGHPWQLVTMPAALITPCQLMAVRACILGFPWTHFRSTWLCKSSARRVFRRLDPRSL